MNKTDWADGIPLKYKYELMIINAEMANNESRKEQKPKEEVKMPRLAWFK